MIEILQSVLSFDGNVAFAIIVLILLLCGLGLPLPEEIPIVGAAYLAAKGEINTFVAITFVISAILIGDSLIFYIGKRFGNQIFESKFFKKALTPKRMEKTNHYFHKYGSRVVFIGRFLAGIRASIFITAGVLQMPFRKFLFLDGLAALISIPLNIYVVIFLVKKFDAEIDVALYQVRQAGHLILTLAAAIVILSLLFIYLRKKASTAPGVPTETDLRS